MYFHSIACEEQDPPHVVGLNRRHLDLLTMPHRQVLCVLSWETQDVTEDAVCARLFAAEWPP